MRCDIYFREFNNMIQSIKFYDKLYFHDNNNNNNNTR